MRLRQFILIASSLAYLFNLAVANSAQAKAAANFVINTPQLNTTLADLKGKVVYVDFWASWCKPCRQSFPWMNQMQEKYASAGLQIIAINLDAEPDLAQGFLAKVPANMPIVYDPQGKIAKEYQLLGMPSSYLIDKNGQLRLTHKGFFSQKQAQYEQEINSLLSEKE